ncbi:hypothetical protein INT46_005519 [Mucor plumbeus]|uniref:Uncharacterized protein n=1 Tax=Mucor plumbeus TaxID=97098 RepID=A0A8H7V8Z2_9FUNG|nr:hypothetical protein INT46_005519 [Mucor plumbeus]
MRFTTFTIAILLIYTIIVDIVLTFPSDNDTITEPDQEICILSIVPCPKRCINTCIYPDLPCPNQYPPHCPNKKPRSWPPHQKRTKNAVETKAETFDSNAVVIEQYTDNKSTCSERPCPRVIFKSCPKECLFSCEFQNPSNPCCPYSGKPVFDFYKRKGEKGLDIGDNEKTIFKLDAKLVLLYVDKEYPVSVLLVEAKTIYGKNIDLNANEEYATLLSIVILQIMGLEAHEMFIKNVAKGLYVYHTIETFMLPSTAPEMKKRATNIIGFLFDFKVE